MTLHFLDAHTYPLPCHGTGVQFVCPTLAYTKLYHTQLKLSQHIKSLLSAGQEKRILPCAVGVAIDSIRITWQLSGLPFIGGVPYPAFVAFRVANQAAIDWNGHNLNVSQ